ncbi:hypothetical protein SPV2_gp30 [Sulfolobus polyhedral virus 2]|uniref:Uncharacterized protein n=1 Tax=Sulfolobus polyhedral virus 2 TaxID=2493125 RepID=A0A3Q8Q9R0_9VIRU|nr:hypothetical protein KM458_gp30 [Sulfolobus polyhedral virus 2]AZI76029.1 hypothetical protein SPV2_gp30 [Sulfolobus polyhedral virus 2]
MFTDVKFSKNLTAYRQTHHRQTPGTQSKNSLENSVYIQYTYTQTHRQTTNRQTHRHRQTQQQTKPPTTDTQF